MLKNNKSKFGRKATLAVSTLFAISSILSPLPAIALDDAASTAATTAPTDSLAVNQNTGTIVLEPGRAKKLTFDHRLTKFNALQPDIANVVTLAPNELLFTGSKPGLTQVIVWDESGHTQILDVEVTSPIAQLRKKLQVLFPDSKINVEDNNGVITLTGQVHDLQTADEVAQVTAPFGKPLNLLEIGGGQQVMLKVKFAEVSKSAEQELGFNFGGTDGVSFVGAGQGNNPLSNNGSTLFVPSGIASAMFGGGAFGKTAFAYFIDALEKNSLLRVLAEPDLVTTSGQEATFLAGGSFPYPVPQSSGSGTTITIQFQDYGVNLKFTPIVLGNGRIRLKVAPEVSQLDFSTSVTVSGLSVPGLTKRNVNTTVELSEGQTLALAGLLQTNVSASNNQFPVLGDLPIIGALFRSVKYQKDQTELVVMVTPELVHGIDPADVTPAVGEKWRDPSPFELYFLKDLGGEQPDPKASLPTQGNNAVRYHGDAGFTPPETNTTGK